MTYEEDLELENDELRAKAACLGSRLEEVEAHYESANGEITDLENQLEEAVNKINSLEEDLHETNEKLETAKDDLETSQDKLEEIDAAVKKKVEDGNVYYYYNQVESATLVESDLFNQRDMDIQFLSGQLTEIEKLEALLEDYEECRKIILEDLRERMTDLEYELSSLKKSRKESGES